MFKRKKKIEYIINDRLLASFINCKRIIHVKTEPVIYVSLAKYSFENENSDLTRLF